MNLSLSTLIAIVIKVKKRGGLVIDAGTSD